MKRQIKKDAEIPWINFVLLYNRYTVKRSKDSIGMSVVMDPMANKWTLQWTLQFYLKKKMDTFNTLLKTEQQQCSMQNNVILLDGVKKFVACCAGNIFLVATEH